jgi:hypothetical protein
MKILIIGGVGFGNEVVCVDNFYTGKKKNVKELLVSGKF